MVINYKTSKVAYQIKMISILFSNLASRNYPQGGLIRIAPHKMWGKEDLHFVNPKGVKSGERICQQEIFL